MTVDTSAALVREVLPKLSSSDLSPDEFLYEVSIRIGRVVPFDASAWLTLDPDTLLSSGTLVTEQPTEHVRTLWRNELLDDDVFTLTALARLRSPVVALSQLDPASGPEKHASSSSAA